MDKQTGNSKFRNYLNSELEKRQSKNEGYSLRAFARFLDIDPPTLSKIMNGKKLIGNRLIKRLSDRLGADHLNFASTDIEQIKENFRLINEDTIQFMSKWYYYGILELLEVEDFKNDSEWIAKRLGITKHQAKTAIERMLRLDMLSEKDGELIDNTGGKSTFIGKEVSSSARREHQRDILELALDALEDVDPLLRDQSSMTLAFNTEYLPEVKDLIKKFRRDLSKFVDSKEQKNEVYNLGISFYPVTKDIK